MKKTMLVATLLFSSLSLAQSAVPAKFWGMQFNKTTSPYPVTGGPTFETFRFWDTGTSWNDIQTSASCTSSNLTACDFTKFDTWMNNYVNATGQPKLDVIYTIGKTPNFISSNQNDTCNGSPAGSCVPPTDVTCTGTSAGNTGGTDQTFINFLQALWTHIVNNNWNTGRQWYVEGWNEPNSGAVFWDQSWIDTTYCPGDNTANRRILARLAADARTTILAIDSTVKFLTPPASSARTAVKSGGWWYKYLSGDGGAWGKGGTCSGYTGSNPCGGGQFADEMSVHGYLDNTTNETPDDICCSSTGSDGSGTLVYNTLATMSSFGQGSKPLFLTEGSWGAYCKTGCPAGFDPVSWTGRYYTLMLSQGKVARFAWYNYDTFAPIWCLTIGTGCAVTGQLSTTGIATYQLQSVWNYVGGTFGSGGCTSTATSCTGSGHIRACPLTEGTTGKSAQVAWYDSYNNTCPYTPAGSGWSDYRDLQGNFHSDTGGSVTLGNSPLLFEK